MAEILWWSLHIVIVGVILWLSLRSWNFFGTWWYVNSDRSERRVELEHEDE